MKFKKLFWNFILILSLTSFAQFESWNIELVEKSFYGLFRCSYSVDDYCYASTGSKMVCYDMSDIANPEEIAVLDVVSEINDIYVEGPYLYLLLKYVGIEIYDISDISSPVLISSLIHTDYNSDGEFTVTDDYIYISSLYDEFCIIDKSDISSPYVVFSSNDLELQNKLNTYENFLYIAMDTGFNIINVENPATPENVGLINVDYSLYSEARVSHRLNGIIVGNYFYVFLSNYMLIYDLENPVEPEFLLGYKFDYSIWNFRFENIYHIENQIIAASTNNLYVFDVTAPLAPIVTCCYNNIFNIDDLSVTEDYAVILDDSEGLITLDLSSPISPLNIRQCDFPGESIHCENYTVDSNYVLIANGSNSYAIVDVTDSLNPELIVSTVTDQPVYDIDVSGHYAYFAQYNSGLVVYDLTDIHSPVEISSYALNGATDIEVKSNFAYILTYSGFLYVIDITEPLHLVEVSFERVYDSYDLEIVEDYLYTTSRTDIKCFDITDPSAIWEISSSSICDYGYDLCIEGDYAYVAVDDSGIQIFDISSPDTLVPVSKCKLPWSLEKVDIYEDYLIASHDDILFLVDVADPDNPKCCREFNSNGDFCSFRVGKYLFYEYGNDLIVTDLSVDMFVRETCVIEHLPSIGILHIINDDYAFVYKDRGYYLYEMHDRISFEEVDSIPHHYVTGIEPFGDYYVSFYRENFWIYDYSDVLSPVQICEFSEHYYDLEYRSFEYSESLFAFETEERGIFIYDVSDVTNPSLKKEIDLYDVNIYDHKFYDDKLLVSGEIDSTETDVLFMYDISNPDSITLFDTYYISAETMVLKDNNLFVSKSRRCSIYGISEDAELSLINIFYVDTQCRSINNIIVSGDYLFIGTYFDGVHVYNIRLLDFVTEIGYYFTGVYTEYMQIYGDYLYVTNGGHLFILDISRFTEGITEDEAILPEKCELSCYPNPFNSTVNINIPGDSEEVRIYDISGRTYFESNIPHSSIRWTPSETANSGVYLVDVTLTNGEKITEKIIYVK